MGSMDVEGLYSCRETVFSTAFSTAVGPVDTTRPHRGVNNQTPSRLLDRVSDAALMVLDTYLTVPQHVDGWG